MRDKINKFMQGRYGVDQFARFTLGVALFLVVIGSFMRRSAVGGILDMLGFILIISLILNLLIGAVGQQQLASFISTKPILGPVLAGLVGLIPNCASSVVLTQLYLEGVLGAGAMIGGLLAGQGVGLLVLYRVNDNLKENIRITILLYVIGVAVGIITEMLGIAF